MKAIRIQGVTKRFAGGVTAVDAVDLEVEAGEFMVLVGPSGCGKTTLLRMLAGLETVSDGCILLDGNDITHVHARRRDIAMVFQDYALYPQMTVEANLSFALRMRKLSKEDIRSRVTDVAATLELEPLLDRRPHALSGGQRQRVALGRAIVREPAAFLMDEPLSNLDAKLRGTMRSELARLHARLNVTTVYVTHDQVEAMTLGGRVAVMSEGRVQQCGTPREVYERPANAFVAAFMGSPPMNLVTARIDGDTAVAGPLRVALPRDAAVEETVTLGVRPNALQLASESDPAAFAAVVDVVEELGDERLVGFRVGGESGTDATAKLPSAGEIRIGDRIHLTVVGDVHFFAADTGTALGVAPPVRHAATK